MDINQMLTYKETKYLWVWLLVGSGVQRLAFRGIGIQGRMMWRQVGLEIIGNKSNVD